MAASPQPADPRTAHEAHARIRAIQQRQEQAARQLNDQAAAREAAEAVACAEADIARLRIRLRSLQEENDALREQLAALVESDDGIRSVPLEWGLSRQEANLLVAIYNQGQNSLTRSAALAALYGSDADQRDRNVPAVLVFRIRRKLAARSVDLVIETYEQRGYRLSAASLDAFAALTGAPSRNGGVS